MRMGTTHVAQARSAMTKRESTDTPAVDSAMAGTLTIAMARPKLTDMSRRVLSAAPGLYALSALVVMGLRRAATPVWRVSAEEATSITASTMPSACHATGIAPMRKKAARKAR